MLRQPPDDKTLQGGDEVKLRLFKILTNQSEHDMFDAVFTADDIAKLLLWEERDILRRISWALYSYEDFELKLNSSQEFHDRLKRRLIEHLTTKYWDEHSISTPPPNF